MTHLHICLTTLPGQLVRWQKAFPYGRMVTQVDDLLPYAQHDLVIWLHLDSLKDERLPEIISELRAKCPGARIVALTNLPAPARTMDLLKQGLRGCCHTLSTPELFKKIAKVTANGGYWLGEDLLNRIIRSVPNTQQPNDEPARQSALAVLSRRERDVARLVAQGASNREIAEQLAISEKTVKAHLSTIFGKLSVRDRVQLALIVRQTS